MAVGKRLMMTVPAASVPANFMFRSTQSLSRESGKPTKARSTTLVMISVKTLSTLIEIHSMWSMSTGELP